MAERRRRQIDCGGLSSTKHTNAMKPYEVLIKNQCILYDADETVSMDFNLFDADHLERCNMITHRVRGRGIVTIFSDGTHQYVLRHYWRGGRIAHLLTDRYLWTGLRRSRAWREWFLLMQAQQHDLPAPKPYAARVIRHGMWYRADLITHCCPNAKSVASRISDPELTDAVWIKIGRVIRKFHLAGFYHADLNANNILVSPEGDVSLIDFDKGELRPPNEKWQMQNLARLKRSLRKLSLSRSNSDRHFDLLVQGYRSHEVSVSNNSGIDQGV